MIVGYSLRMIADGVTDVLDAGTGDRGHAG